MSMYVDYDLLMYLGTLKRRCKKCGFDRDHHVDILKDRYHRKLVLTVEVYKLRQAQCVCYRGGVCVSSALA